jgi:hypothetical protein
MKTKVVIAIIFTITMINSQTYGMENVSQIMVNKDRQSSLFSDPHDYQLLTKDEQKKSALLKELKEVITANNPNLNELQLNKTGTEAIYINNAIQQKNIAIIDQLSKESTDIVNEDSEYYKTRKRQLWCKAISIGLIAITAMGISSGIGYWIWTQYPFNCTLMEDFLSCGGYNFNIKCDPFSCNLPCTITCSPCDPFSKPICTGPTQTLPCKAQVGNGALLCNGVFTPMCQLISYCYNHS